MFIQHLKYNVYILFAMVRVNFSPSVHDNVDTGLLPNPLSLATS